MREAGEKLLSKYRNFISINGTAEDTTLENNSIDLITAGQAFHWFDVEKCKIEFKRIIKPGGFAALIWNIKNSKASPLMKDYEKLQLEHGTDYKKIRHEKIGEKEFNILFDNGYTKKFFDNEQVLDYVGEGRILSASYVPLENSRVQAMLADLDKMFNKHSRTGK
jgi:SAM-dependent methyltransferase